MKQRNSKTTERTVYVEFQSGINVHVFADSDKEAVNAVNRLVMDRRLDFDADSVRDDLLDNVVTIRCGETEIYGSMTKVSRNTKTVHGRGSRFDMTGKNSGRDPFRFSIETKVGANEGFVLDENAKQFAESVVNYPTETSWVKVRKVDDDLGERYFVYGQFHNDDGHTEHVDDCLEQFTMRHWREIADHITRLMLADAGESDESIDLTDWPTPEIAVTKTADVHDGDCIDLVKFEWVTSERVFNILVDRLMNPEEEETCPHCDTVVTFRPEEGKDILVCPECGRAFCACSLCDCQNHGNCDECETTKACERIYNAKEVNP